MCVIAVLPEDDCFELNGGRQKMDKFGAVLTHSTWCS